MPLDPEKIKSRREHLTYSQGEMARRAGMSVQQWNALETGKKEDPRVATVETVAKALRCKIDDLMDPKRRLRRDR